MEFQLALNIAKSVLKPKKPNALLETLSRGLRTIGEAVGRYIVWRSIHVQERFELLKKRKDTGPFTEQDFDDWILKQQQEEEESKCQRRERKKEKKEKAAKDEAEVDADVAAIMGFGGFGSSKK